MSRFWLFIPILCLASCIPSPLLAQPAMIGPVDEVQVHQKTERERRSENRRRVIPGLVASHLLDIGDIVTTHECSKSPRCNEGNSIYGSRNPSLGTIVAIKGTEMAVTTLVALLVGGEEPIGGYAFLIAKGSITGKNVIGNIRIVW